MSDWSETLEKLSTLKTLDKTCQVFGARGHRYTLGPKCTEAELATWEATNKAQLPPELRSFLAECGNGGAGPFLGMKPLEKMRVYAPDKPYIGDAALLALAKNGYDAEDDACDYYYEEDTLWDVPDTDLSGLITVIGYGGGSDICLVTAGPNIGTAVFRSSDYGLMDGGSLKTYFKDWLDTELAYFETIEALLQACDSAEDLDIEFDREHASPSGRDYMVSFLGIEKPANLFGDDESRHHGAVQFPWYEEQFTAHKRKRDA